MTHQKYGLLHVHFILFSHFNFSKTNRFEPVYTGSICFWIADFILDFVINKLKFNSLFILLMCVGITPLWRPRENSNIRRAPELSTIIGPQRSHCCFCHLFWVQIWYFPHFPFFCNNEQIQFFRWIHLYFRQYLDRDHLNTDLDNENSRVPKKSKNSSIFNSLGPVASI